MTRQVDSFRRAANAAVELLAEQPAAVARSYPRTERKDALAIAEAVKIIAAGALAAAEAAITGLQAPPPPAQHYHQAPPLRPLRDPRGGTTVAMAE